MNRADKKNPDNWDQRFPINSEEVADLELLKQYLKPLTQSSVPTKNPSSLKLCKASYPIDQVPLSSHRVVQKTSNNKDSAVSIQQLAEEEKIYTVDLKKDDYQIAYSHIIQLQENLNSVFKTEEGHYYAAGEGTHYIAILGENDQGQMVVYKIPLHLQPSNITSSRTQPAQPNRNPLKEAMQEEVEFFSKTNWIQSGFSIQNATNDVLAVPYLNGYTLKTYLSKRHSEFNDHHIKAVKYLIFDLFINRLKPGDLNPGNIVLVPNQKGASKNTDPLYCEFIAFWIDGSVKHDPEAEPTELLDDIKNEVLAKLSLCFGFLNYIFDSTKISAAQTAIKQTVSKNHGKNDVIITAANKTVIDNFVQEIYGLNEKDVEGYKMKLAQHLNPNCLKNLAKLNQTESNEQPNNDSDEEFIVVKVE